MLAVKIPGFRVYAGGNLGFEVSCSVETAVPLNGFGCDDSTQAFDVGLKGGAGIQLLLFTLDAAVTYGISNISSIEGLDMKNRTLYISAGVVLPSL
jgi:hypothetical protein